MNTREGGRFRGTDVFEGCKRAGIREPERRCIGVNGYVDVFEVGQPSRGDTRRDGRAQGIRAGAGVNLIKAVECLIAVIQGSAVLVVVRGSTKVVDTGSERKIV